MHIPTELPLLHMTVGGWVLLPPFPPFQNGATSSSDLYFSFPVSKHGGERKVHATVGGWVWEDLIYWKGGGSDRKREGVRRCVAISSDTSLPVSTFSPTHRSYLMNLKIAKKKFVAQHVRERERERREERERERGERGEREEKRGERNVFSQFEKSSPKKKKISSLPSFSPQTFVGCFR